MSITQTDEKDIINFLISKSFEEVKFLTITDISNILKNSTKYNVNDYLIALIEYVTRNFNTSEDILIKCLTFISNNLNVGVDIKDNYIFKLRAKHIEYLSKGMEVNTTILTLILDIEKKLSLLKEVKNSVKENEKQEINFDAYDKFLNSNSRECVIRNIILASLYKKKLTLNEIVANILKQGIRVTKEEVLEYINEMKPYINIEKVGFKNDSVCYGIDIPPLDSDKTFTITTDKNSLNFLVISDLHANLCADFKTKYDKVLDYCKNKNIDYVLNGGDILTCVRKNEKRNLKLLKEVLEKYRTLALELPQTDDIKQLYVAGNHERLDASLGIDFAKLFTDVREDFVFLGYHSTTLTIDYHHKELANLLLAHPSSSICRKNVWPKLKDLSHENGRDVSDYNCFLLAHSHERIFDEKNKLCVLPSLTHDNIENGALHLKLHLNNNKLECLEALPLVLDKKLHKNGKPIYLK